MVKVFLKPGKEVPVLRFHPWIFSGAIARTEGNPADGDVAEVYDRGGRLLGAGHFHHGSIAVRLLSFGPADLVSEAFWVDKLRNALAVRAATGLAGAPDTDCSRRGRRPVRPHRRRVWRYGGVAVPQHRYAPATHPAGCRAAPGFG